MVESINLNDPRTPDPLICEPHMEWKLNVAPLKPSIDETVGLLSPGLWSIGSFMFCKILRDGEDMPPDVICSWSDDGATYYLQKRSMPRVDRTPEGDFLASRHPRYWGVARGIWNLSQNVFCKVKGWTEGLTTEPTTNRWMRKMFPSIPTEEIIYDWIDPEWNRVVMISKRVPGEQFRTAWPGLTKQQKLHLADQIAVYMKALSEMTSDYVETVQGTALEGSWSLRVREAVPHWKPLIEPRVSREDLEAYEKRYNSYNGLEMVAPGIGEPLVLQHPFFDATNFFVTTPSDPDQMPKVTGIIGWERVGYLPKWRIATNPRACPQFIVETPIPCVDDHDWQWMVSNACVRAGLPLEIEYMKERRRKESKYAPHKWAKVNCSNLPTEERRDIEEK